MRQFLTFVASFFILCSQALAQEKPYPIEFAIPEVKIVKEIPPKERDFAFIMPREPKTYIYSEEADYYEDYQRSYFAVTCAKGGWDCMRHYEILANGCIPYFVDLDKCHPDTLYFLPKKLILEAMSLEGVSYLHIDHRRFNKARYYEILNQLLAHTREHLTTKAMAGYLLKKINYRGSGKILYLSKDASPDYMRCLLLIGLKELLGDRIVDYPKIEHAYKSYPGNVKALYGKGFSFTKIIDDVPVDRDNIEQRIQNKEFDLIIYGSVHRGRLFRALVEKTYEQEKIISICGEDYHDCQYSLLHNLFLREFDAYRKE